MCTFVGRIRYFIFILFVLYAVVTLKITIIELRLIRRRTRVLRRFPQSLIPLHVVSVKSREILFRAKVNQFFLYGG